jgi:hypothetical protein
MTKPVCERDAENQSCDGENRHGYFCGERGAGSCGVRAVAGTWLSV